VYDVKEHQGSPCIIMEFIEGTSLADVLRSGERMELSEAVRIISYTARALQHAHEFGIIHRDIKPENIMLNKKGKVKVMDFGIAFSGELPRLTQRGFAVGTPQYMSPEQLRGKPVDGRSDIYSLSVLFFYLVAGRLPFEDNDPRELGLKHIRQPPPSPTEFNPHVPADIERIILRGMEKKPEDRFQTAGELEVSLADFLMKSSQPSLTTALAAFHDSVEASEKFIVPGALAQGSQAASPSPNDKVQAPAAAEPRPAPAASAPEPAAPAPPATPKAGVSPVIKAAASVLILALIGAVTVYVMMTPSKEERLTDLMSRATMEIRRGNFDRAERIYREALQLDPASNAVSDGIANLARVRGNFDGSISVARQMMEAGQVQGARQALESARRILPDHPSIAELDRRLSELEIQTGGEGSPAVVE
jgi:serine/threonine-protein kinase